MFVKSAVIKTQSTVSQNVSYVTFLSFAKNRIPSYLAVSAEPISYWEHRFCAERSCERKND